MSIASELSALNGYILGAYDEINDKGGTVPANKNMANLASAIASISTGTPTTITPLNVTENGTYTAPTGTAYSPVTVNVSGGGGGDIVSGVIEYASETNLNSFPNYVLTHNLGKEPKGICWFVVNAPLSGENVNGIANGVLAQYVDENVCYKLAPYNPSKAGTWLYEKASTSYNISQMFFLDQPHSETMQLIHPNFQTVSSRVPAGSKIVWFVWG